MNAVSDNLVQLFNRVKNDAFDHLIAPPFCAYCKTFLSARMIFCIECDQLIKPIVSVRLPIHKNLMMTVMAISHYQEPLKSMLLAKSWSDITACNQLGQLIWQKTYFAHMPCDYLVPIPLHWLRLAKRGYNQAEEIAHELGRHKKVPTVSLLKRTRNTPFQSSLPIEDRASNVHDVFSLKSVDAALYQDKHLVLVDDLMTTGSTLVAAAKVLAPLKPASINAIVACRAI